jgi:transposase
MLTFATTQRIYLARAVVDMRKSFDSLTSLVRNQLGKDPFTGDAFVFVGKGRDRVKILVWDVSGFWVCAKRLEKGAFALPKPAMAKEATSSLPLSVAEVHLLLEGIDVHAATYKGHYHRPGAGATTTATTAEKADNCAPA